MTRTIYMASNSTRGANYTIETDTTNIIDIAYKYGRAESGEVVKLLNDNGEVDATAGWDSQYRKYRKQMPNGSWL